MCGRKETEGLRAGHEQEVQGGDLRIVGRVELGILGVIVTHIFQADPGGIELILLNIIARRRPAEIVAGANAGQDLDEAGGLLTVYAFQAGGAHEASVCNPKFAGQGDGQIDGEICQEDILALIKGLNQRGVLLKPGRAGVGNGEGLPVVFGPGFGPVDFDILDRDALGDAGAMDRDGDPLFTLSGLDLVAIAPAVLVILDIVIEDEQISARHLVKISTPGDIGGLQDDNVHSRSTAPVVLNTW